MAHYFDWKFLPSRYDYFTEHWNQFIDWKQSEKAYKGEALYQLIEMVDILNDLDKDGINRTFDFEKSTNIRKVKRIIDDQYAKGKQLLVRLPFDQFPGKLLKKTDTIHRDLQNCLKLRELSSYDISIHIRRGDVNMVNNHSRWCISDEIYEILLRELSSEFPNETICCYSQLNTDGSIPLAKIQELPNVTLNISNSTWTNKDEIDAFSQMMGSKVIIGGRSAFSQLAHFCSKNEQQFFIGLIKDNDKGFYQSTKSSFHKLCADINISTINSILQEVKNSLP
ncbi:hypothetical protein [Synechococcus sp. CS-197]|uniref:hypothetical protein n=1 Tax=Synechococcus sp. CS-197 TaxID=2847985 RepID=UPI00223C40BD|nr:hypothetical protein [Synechococcus sp. CS-197]MCT0250814.1 hypothetical protein [Synechococcus sp. CS-197]